MWSDRQMTEVQYQKNKSKVNEKSKTVSNEHRVISDIDCIGVRFKACEKRPLTSVNPKTRPKRAASTTAVTTRQAIVCRRRLSHADAAKDESSQRVCSFKRVPEIRRNASV